MKFIRLVLLTLAAFTLMAQAAPVAPAGDPSGNWSFSVKGPRGKTLDATLTLKWAEGQLTGSVSNRAGTATISNGSFADGQVAFTVVRELRGREITTNYSGKLEGDKLTGTIETSGPKGKSVSVAWVAQRGTPAAATAP